MPPSSQTWCERSSRCLSSIRQCYGSRAVDHHEQKILRGNRHLCVRCGSAATEAKIDRRGGSGGECRRARKRGVKGRHGAFHQSGNAMGAGLLITTSKRFCEATVTCVFAAAVLLRRQKSTEE